MYNSPSILRENFITNMFNNISKINAFVLAPQHKVRSDTNQAL